jgi:hypothetical protein
MPEERKSSFSSFRLILSAGAGGKGPVMYSGELQGTIDTAADGPCLKMPRHLTLAGCVRTGMKEE